MPNEPQLQSSLGEVTSNKTMKDRNWNRGYLAFGKVLHVHPKRYTADVQIYGTNDVIVSAKDQEGRHACRIGVSNAGYSEKYKKAYGEIVPIEKGSIVLVGFLKNSKEKPVILRVFHNIAEELGESNFKNMLDAMYASETDDSVDRYLNISKIQDFVTVDSEGNFEIASHTKSFFVGKERAMDDECFDFEDLEIKNPDQTTRSVDERYSKPKKYIAVFRDNFKDSLTNWLKIIVDATKTSFRLAKLQQSDNKSTYLEVDQNGAFKVRRQLDTKSFEGSKHYAEITISSQGKIECKFTGATRSVFTINSDGSEVRLETTDPINIISEQDILVKGDNINIIAEQDVNVTAGQNVNVTASQSINMKAPVINLN